MICVLLTCKTLFSWKEYVVMHLSKFMIKFILLFWVRMVVTFCNQTSYNHQIIICE